jgi:hypothetical protein
LKKTSAFAAALLVILFSVPAFAAADGILFPASPPTHKSYLFEGEKVSSPNGQYVLTMQTDGNLVLYKGNCVGDPNCAVWNSKTYREQGQYYMAMQEDGNLVIYRGRPPARTDLHIWASQTYGPIGNYFLSVQDDGDLVIYRGTCLHNNRGPIWSAQKGKLQ